MKFERREGFMFKYNGYFDYYLTACIKTRFYKEFKRNTNVKTLSKILICNNFKRWTSQHFCSDYNEEQGQNKHKKPRVLIKNIWYKILVSHVFILWFLIQIKSIVQTENFNK